MPLESHWVAPELHWLLHVLTHWPPLQVRLASHEVSPAVQVLLHEATHWPLLHTRFEPQGLLS